MRDATIWPRSLTRWLTLLAATTLAAACGNPTEPPCVVTVGGVPTDLCSPGGRKVLCKAALDEAVGCVAVSCPDREDAHYCPGAIDDARSALEGTTCEASAPSSECLAIACGAGAPVEACRRECGVTGLSGSDCATLACDGDRGALVCRSAEGMTGLDALVGTSCEAADSGAGCTAISCADGSAAALCEGVPCAIEALEAGGCARLVCDGGARTTVCAGSDPMSAAQSLGAKSCSAAFPDTGCVTARCSGGTEARLCDGASCAARQRDACVELVCDGAVEASVCGGPDGLTQGGELATTSCALRLDGTGCAELRCADGSTGSVCGARTCGVQSHASGCAALTCGEAPAVTFCSPDIAPEALAYTGCTQAPSGGCTRITCGDGSQADVCAAALPALDFAGLLAKAVRFYGAQRSGSTDNWLLGGEACHEADGESIGRDLAGGWHDAGDHIKFSLTIAYATYALFKAYDAFPLAFDDTWGASYGPRNGLPDVLDEAVVGADYLVKLLEPDGDRVVTRVGDESDHALWVTCLYQENLAANRGGRPRPVRLGTDPDVAALSAAALATGARVMARFDPGRASAWLDAARALFAFAEEHAAQAGYTDTYYTNSSTLDDRLCGAAELWAATSEQGFLDAARSLDARRGTHGWVLSWGEVSDLCRHTLVKRGQASRGYAADGALVDLWQIDLERYLGKRDARGVAAFDEWGLLRYALGAAFSAALAFDAYGDERYRSFAVEQVAYAAGVNSAGYSFIVGFGERSPRFPHHRNAYGVNSNPSDQVKDSVPPRHVLEGALVGGASPPEAFPDRLTDYKTSEVSIDFNAALVGAAAFAASLADR